MLIRRASELRHREVGVVGSAGGDVGAAVVRTFRTSAYNLQIVTVLDQAQTNVCREEWLLSLEQLQPLLHLPLEFLMLQLLLLVNTLWQQDKLELKFPTYKNTVPVKSSQYCFICLTLGSTWNVAVRPFEKAPSLNPLALLDLLWGR